MRGAIHGIWFTGPGGKLHPEIIPNLTAMLASAKQEDYYLILWTNTSEIDPQEIAKLKAANITVSDHRACKDSPIYKYFDYFLQRGIKGDKAAFGLASDIFRMAILDFTAADKYFIYFDVNDIVMTNLVSDLHNLEHEMADNRFGFAFPVKPIAEGARILETRNDLLIARKDLNPEFFNKYLQAYWFNLEHTYKTYKKPTINDEATLSANIISNETSPIFFILQIEPNRPIKVLAQFGDYEEYSQVIDAGTYIKYARNKMHSGTWLENEKEANVQELLANQGYATILQENQKAIATNLKNAPHKSLYLGISGIVLFISVCAVWIFYRNRKNA